MIEGLNIIENENENMSPMMKQYFEILKDNDGAILFFRVGDFYETFFEQAKLVSKLLNIALTGKECGLKEKAPMCGVPYHAVDVYMSKLVKLGYKVAIAEQMEDPKLTKGIVKREVTRVITPGTVLSTEYLDDKVNNFIISVYYSKGKYGISLLDFSTGDFFISDVNDEKAVEDMFTKYEPRELLINNNAINSSLDVDGIKNRYMIASTLISDDVYDLSKLKNKDNVVLDKLLKTLPNYKDIKDDNSIYAAIAAYDYVKANQKSELSHIETIEYIDDSKYMYLDTATIMNLELTEGIRDRERKGTLINILDKTKTSMGGRLLYRYCTWK